VLLGDSGVGKTCIVRRYVENDFTSEFKSTIGADFSGKTIRIDGIDVNIQIWDTAGQERFHAIGTAFYRGTGACILVFDLTSMDSFKNINRWRESLVESAQGTRPDKFPFVAFANKVDMTDERQVTVEEVGSYKAESGIPVFEVSAKTGDNVDEGFEAVVRMHLQYSCNDIDAQPIRILVPAERGCACESDKRQILLITF
jgi:Ras-related protein Rab-7A